MLFNSVSFLIFFPVVTGLYFALPHRFRQLLLLVASGLFYAAFIPKYLLVLLVVIAIDFAAGIGIEASAGGRRKALLGLSLGANIGILAVFKYFNFLNDNLGQLASALHIPWAVPSLTWALPIGLSFHTFQSMAYTIEVYKGRYPAERSLTHFALYVLFYPQLVAGPIERPQHLLPQLAAEHRFDADRAFDGLRLMLWGLFKKMVIADRMALIVDLVYKSPASFGAGWIVVATWFFAIQIYCDFSGYSDTAIGAARVMGVDLRVNFERPYEAASIAEFWRRWHMSLSTWFRDYVYLPLGGNRVILGRWMGNVMTVFILSGLWHGANWTFVVWGALHGFYLVFGRLTSSLRERIAATTGLASRPRLRRAWGMFVTFQLVSLAWLFFRATSLSEAWALLARFGQGPVFACPNPAEIVALFHVSREGHLLIAVVMVLMMLMVEWAAARRDAQGRWAAAPVWVRWPAYYALIVMILWMGDLGARSFIYFQF